MHTRVSGTWVDYIVWRASPDPSREEEGSGVMPVPDLQ